MADVVFAVLELAVQELCKAVKRYEDSKRELQELGNFILDLRASSPIVNPTFTSRSYRLNQVKTTLEQELERARKKVEKWSRNNSDFFHSGDRLRKIQGVRQRVKMAVGVAKHQLAVYNLQVLEEMHEFMKLNSSRSQHNQKHPKISTRSPTPNNCGHHQKRDHGSSKPDVASNKREHRRAKSAGRVERIYSRSSNPRVSTPRKDDKKVELYVPMDSDKQAMEVKGKLKALLGVKDVFIDQTLKQVVVVPLKGTTLNTDQLLRHAKLDNKVMAPTLWSKRPR